MHSHAREYESLQVFAVIDALVNDRLGIWRYQLRRASVASIILSCKPYVDDVSSWCDASNNEAIELAFLFSLIVR